MCKGPALPFSGPSACTNAPLCVVKLPPFQKRSEMEDDAGGNAQIILRVAAAQGAFRETSQQIIEFHGAKADMVSEAKIKAAAEGGGKSVVRVCGLKQIGVAVSDAEQGFTKRLHAIDVTQ